MSGFNAFNDLILAQPLAVRAAIGAFVAVLVVVVCMAWDARRRVARLEYGGPRIGLSRGSRGRASRKVRGHLVQPIEPPAMGGSIGSGGRWL